MRCGAMPRRKPGTRMRRAMIQLLFAGLGWTDIGPAPYRSFRGDRARSGCTGNRDMRAWTNVHRPMKRCVATLRYMGECRAGHPFWPFKPAGGRRREVRQSGFFDREHRASAIGAAILCGAIQHAHTGVTGSTPVAPAPSVKSPDTRSTCEQNRRETRRARRSAS